jgi:hypothetical protein
VIPRGEEEKENPLLPLIVERRDVPLPVDQETRFNEGDEVVFLVFEERRDEALGWLGDHGWVPAFGVDPP